jgi:hypothetical protein
MHWRGAVRISLIALTLPLTTRPPARCCYVPHPTATQRSEWFAYDVVVAAEVGRQTAPRSPHVLFAWREIDETMANLMLAQASQEVRVLIHEDEQLIYFQNIGNGNGLAAPSQYS